MFNRRQFLTAGMLATIGAAMSPGLGHAQTNRNLPTAAWFDRRFGVWVAGDVPRAFDIGAGRTLWATNDSFLASTSSTSASIDDSKFVRNALFVEINGRLALTHPAQRAFLNDESTASTDQWWWFHGGMVLDDRLHVFLTRMKRIGQLGWAINFKYSETWLASISTLNWQLVDLRPAPNIGTRPVYGFAVTSDRDWTYLHGNNALYGQGTTSNYLARVPYGELDANPLYWDGSKWSKEPTDAASVHTDGSYAYRMHVIRAGDSWLAVCKKDEFFGDRIDILTADRPWGPWRRIRSVNAETISGDEQTCTYDAQCRINDDGIEIWWSNNAFDEGLVRDDAAHYRPSRTRVTV